LHDVILFYSRSTTFTWNELKVELDEAYVESHFRKTDSKGRRFQDISLTGAGIRQGESGLPWRGFDPTSKGRHWALPGSIIAKLGIDKTGTVQEKLDALDGFGRIYWPRGNASGSFPRLKWYLEESEGPRLGDIWTDIPPINSQAQERLGYPTQKPEALLERIIKASSNEGDTVLDPFCGCGTAIAVAQRLNRRWIGIDITHLAVTLIKSRLRGAFGDAVSYRVVGEPVSVPDAAELAANDPYQFQWWALGLVGARPAEGRKGADRGIDGRVFFHDEATGGRTKQIILSVKAGHTGPDHVRDLRGVLDREKAEIGVLLTLEAPTQAMRREAATAGFYHSDGFGRDYARIQLLTIEEILGGKGISYPSIGNVTFKKAPRATPTAPEQLPLVADAPANRRKRDGGQ
jgi:hypothetical protein